MEKVRESRFLLVASLRLRVVVSSFARFSAAKEFLSSEDDAIQSRLSLRRSERARVGLGD